MPHTLQDFLVSSTEKAAADLETAYLRLPEDKRQWSAMDKARTAADLVAECAILNGSTAYIVKNHRFDENFDLEDFKRQKTELGRDWDALRSLLHANTAIFIEALRTVPDEDLGTEIQMPWGPMTLSQIISYPFWNMSYHEGQINFIASMLGCLD